MARARLLKPDFFEDEKLNTLPFGARLLFQAYWCQADREGRLEDRPSRVAAFAFPAMGDEKLQAKARREVIAWRNLLLDAGCLRRYVVDELPYLLVSNFLKHQRIPASEARSVLPGPIDSPDSLRCVPIENLNNNSSTTVAGREVKRSEEKRSEAEAETRARAEPKFLTDPPVPDEPGFVGAFRREYETRYGKLFTWAIDAAQIEREYGTEACVEIAIDCAWEKHPNYLRPKLEDRKNGRLQTAGRHTSGAGARGAGANTGDVIPGWEAYERGE